MNRHDGAVQMTSPGMSREQSLSDIQLRLDRPYPASTDDLRPVGGRATSFGEMLHSLVQGKVKRQLVMTWFALLVGLIGVSIAEAHSFEEQLRKLIQEEKPLQIVDKPTPIFSLVDADGKEVTLKNLQGMVVVLHFIDTKHPNISSAHAKRLAEAQEIVNFAKLQEQVRFISIKTNPSHDTPAMMRKFGSEHGLDPVNWTFLTTKPDQPEDSTRRLAAAFGHKFTKTHDGEKMDGIVAHVIDRNGRWHGNFHGLKFDPMNLMIFAGLLINDHGHAPEGFWGRMEGISR